MSNTQFQEHLYQILNAAAEQGISDVHVRANDGIWAVNQGSLTHFTEAGLNATHDEIVSWLRSAQPENAPADPLGERGHVSAAFDTGAHRARATFRRSTTGVSCSFRLIPAVVPTVEQVGVPQIVQDLTLRRSGLILVEGPTGSGKTTLIAALTDLINRTSAQHIYTIEHPIEFVHRPMMSMFTQREIGIHASDYATAIEDALRSKPNVILIGEMLNPATARAALHAATTGHLVITTAHAGSVTEAIDSFIGQFTADEQPQIRSRLSQSLLAILVQKLVPRVGGGQVPARELMLNSPNFAELIKTGNMQLIGQQLEGNPGNFSVEASLAALHQEGLISEATAHASANNIASLQEKLDRSPQERTDRRSR